MRRVAHAAHVSELMAPHGLQGPAPAVAQGRHAVMKAFRAVRQLILALRWPSVSLMKGGDVQGCHSNQGAC